MIVKSSPLYDWSGFAENSLDVSMCFSATDLLWRWRKTEQPKGQLRSQYV